MAKIRSEWPTFESHMYVTSMPPFNDMNWTQPRCSVHSTVIKACSWSDLAKSVVALSILMPGETGNGSPR